MLSTVIIDGREIKARKGSNLLWAALDSGIFIPNLCAIRENKRPFASCRLCWVEVEGRADPVTACTERISDGLRVALSSAKVKALRKSSFDLLLSHHKIDCGRCPANKRCSLQQIARAEHFRLRDKRLKPIETAYVLDDSHPLFALDRNKCVLCGRCVWVCQHGGPGVLDFAYRGINTMVSTFASIPLSETECSGCLACVDVCPVGALYRKA